MPGEPPGKRRRQERRRETDIVDVDQFADGRALDGLVQKKVEVLQTRGGPGLQRSRRDGVHADVLVAELIGEIADGALQGGFHRTHQIVVRHDLVGAMIAHGQ